MSASPTHTLRLEDWGLTAYDDAFRRQELLVAAHLESSAPSETPSPIAPRPSPSAASAADTLVFTEHYATYTFGNRAGSDQNLLFNSAQLAAQGITLNRTNRGGDITYHGPGQLVGYPIVNLAARKDLHAYLRFLEDVLIAITADLGLTATRRDGKTGIWVGTRKIAAIGVAVRRWIAYHGFALNVCPNLAHFTGIVPCGIAPIDGTVTSLAVELARPITLAEVKPIVIANFTRRWPAFIASKPASER